MILWKLAKDIIVLLAYDFNKKYDSFLELIKAANTDTQVQFENGERCKVTSPVLNPEYKERLVEKIEKVGISLVYITSCSGGDPSSEIESHGFFSYKTYKINIFSMQIRNVRVVFNDGNSINLSLDIKPEFTDFPKNAAEEADFIAVGGQIEEGQYCSIL